MAGHVTSIWRSSGPFSQGVIVDYTVTEKMLKYFISRAIGRRAFRKPRISICVPSGITEIEKRLVEEATYQAGAREVYLAEEPIAAAIGAGVDVTKTLWKSDRGHWCRYYRCCSDLSMAGVVVSSFH
ncbi:MAG: rod shape-determining protein [Blautia wexlerae]